MYILAPALQRSSPTLWWTRSGACHLVQIVNDEFWDQGMKGSCEYGGRGATALPLLNLGSSVFDRRPSAHRAALHEDLFGRRSFDRRAPAQGIHDKPFVYTIADSTSRPDPFCSINHRSTVSGPASQRFPCADLRSRISTDASC